MCVCYGCQSLITILGNKLQLLHYLYVQISRPAEPLFASQGVCPFALVYRLLSTTEFSSCTQLLWYHPSRIYNTYLIIITLDPNTLALSTKYPNSNRNIKFIIPRYVKPDVASLKNEQNQLQSKMRAQTVSREGSWIWKVLYHHIFHLILPLHLENYLQYFRFCSTQWIHIYTLRSYYDVSGKMVTGTLNYLMNIFSNYNANESLLNSRAVVV